MQLISKCKTLLITKFTLNILHSRNQILGFIFHSLGRFTFSFIKNDFVFFITCLLFLFREIFFFIDY